MTILDVHYDEIMKFQFHQEELLK